MHKYKLGQICKLIRADNTWIQPGVDKYVGIEGQITKLVSEPCCLDPKLGPAYGFQSFKDGSTIFASEMALQPRDQECGSWKELEKWYKPPMHRLADAIMEMNPLLRSL